VPDDCAAHDLVELARRTVVAQNENDFDALLRLYAPDAVWDSGGSGLAGERFEGSEAIRSFFEEWLEAFEDMELEVMDIHDLGSGVVFSHSVQHGRPRGSTAPLEFRFATISLWKEGLIRQNRVYANIDQARAAAEQLAQERG
jgi:ketosteroid isomerase-like protein